MTIHLLGSGGFIGKAFQNECKEYPLVCWSHSSKSNFFDLYNPETWSALLDSHPQKVIILSWPGLPMYESSCHLTKNLPYSISLITKLAQSGCRDLLVSGTCAEYGRRSGIFSENQLTQPSNNYAIAKDALRKFLEVNFYEQELRWIWARVFYPYGPGQNPFSLVSRFREAVLSKQLQFELFDGDQLRDYIPAYVLAKQFLALINHPTAMGIYNCSSGYPKSIVSLLEEMKVELGSSINIINRPGQFCDSQTYAFWADMSKFRSLFSDNSWWDRPF